MVLSLTPQCIFVFGTGLTAPKTKKEKHTKIIVNTDFIFDFMFFDNKGC